MLNINKTYAKNTDAVIYEIKYITTQSINNQDIDRELPLYFSFNDVDLYIIEGNENKYLIFALTEDNKEVLELYKKLWGEIKKQIKAINKGESIKYKNDFMKIRLDSHDDDRTLDKILCFSVLDIIADYYPQTLINKCEYVCEYSQNLFHL